MAVFVDSGFYIALQNTRDAHHRSAMRRLDDLVSGRHGQAFISDYLVAEVVNYATRKLNNPDKLIRIMDDVLGRAGNGWLSLLKVDDDAFDAAVELYRAMGARRRLSLTDCTTLALARKMTISSIASFDGGFDGLIDRLS